MKITSLRFMWRSFRVNIQHPAFHRLASCNQSHYSHDNLSTHMCRTVRNCTSSVINQKTNTIFRVYCTSSSDINDNFKRIYKFPYMASVQALCRIKIYQTAITIGMVPVAKLLAPPETALIILGMSAFATVLLFVMGEYFQRFVGIMSINTECNNVKISHLTFWGRRKDIVVPIEDIKPISETSETPFDAYFKLYRFSTREVLYLSLRYGGIIDKYNFEHIFGKL